MDISGLRVRITIQKNETVVDPIGNHNSEWSDWYPCWATATSSSKSQEESDTAGHIVEGDRLDFTVRYCAKVAAVDSKGYRVLMQGRIYNITGIDEMGFKHNSRKFHTELKER